MKIFFIFLGLLVLISSQQLPAPQDLTVDNVFPFIQYQLQDTYWYYLRKATLIYRASIDEGSQFMFLSVHRNLVGTFLIITTWVKGQTSVHVNTLVRLGNGYQSGSGALYGPVKVDPISLSFKLGSTEYFVDTTTLGQLTINDQVVSGNSDGTSGATGNPSELQTKCKQTEKWVRDTYWFYFKDSTVLHTSYRQTSERYLCLYNHINIVGTFLTLASWVKSSGKTQVNTLVKLGNGYQLNSQALYGAVQFTPIDLALTSIQA